MSQQDYDHFKQKIKDWMESHQDEYNCFVGEMNIKSDKGYQQILKTAFALVPKYKKTLTKKINEGDFEDISDIETLFADDDLAEKLIKYVDKSPKNSIIPAMLAWLYYGESFERMVEKGEELRKKGYSYFTKMWATIGVELLISRSISSGFRTKADWKKHSEKMKLAESENVVDWAIDGVTEDEKKKAGRKPDIQILPEGRLTQIEEFVKNNNNQRGLAFLKIALEEMGLVNPGEIQAYRDTLEKEFGDKIEDIKSVRGIQKAYKDLTGDLSVGGQVKDQKKNREFIDQIIEFLSK